MNRVYLDGYNFILRNPKLARIFRESPQYARERLRSLLQDYAALRKRKVYIVYDSRQKVPGQGTRTSGYLCEELFVRDADSYLRDLFRRTRRKRKQELTIVSSDVSDIMLPAKDHGVNVLSSEEFFRQLETIRRNEKPEHEKPPPPRKEEIDEWMRYFEEGEE